MAEALKRKFTRKTSGRIVAAYSPVASGVGGVIAASKTAVLSNFCNCNPCQQTPRSKHNMRVESAPPSLCPVALVHTLTHILALLTL